MNHLSSWLKLYDIQWWKKLAAMRLGFKNTDYKNFNAHEQPVTNFQLFTSPSGIRSHSFPRPRSLPDRILLDSSPKNRFDGKKRHHLHSRRSLSERNIEEFFWRLLSGVIILQVLLNEEYDAFYVHGTHQMPQTVLPTCLSSRLNWLIEFESIEGRKEWQIITSDWIKLFTIWV